MLLQHIYVKVLPSNLSNSIKELRLLIRHFLCQTRKWLPRSDFDLRPGISVQRMQKAGNRYGLNTEY